MRILVTGGAGFIGSHLIDRLMAQGHDVICLDNFFTGSKRNILKWIDNPYFELVRHDITEPIRLEVDQIYHLACPASPVHYQYNPVKTIKTNVIGTLNMLGLAKRVKARFLLASTSEVYGDPDVHPQTEEYRGNVNCIGIRSCYDDKTEILTEDGWVAFPDLKPGDRVATLNPDNQVEYHIPDEYIAQPYIGDLLHFANAKFDFCVTPNHWMYVRSKTGKLKFLRADEERDWHSWRVLTGAEFAGVEPEWFELGQPPRNAKVSVDRIRMDDWLEFFGYYISEGCVHVRKRVRAVNGYDYDVADYNILIAQENPEGRAKIAACLSRLGFKFFQSDDHQFRICSKQLAEILLPFGKSGDKYIPRELLKLSRRQSLILLEALILGDGSQRGNCYSYYTKSKQLADDVQELALRCGYAASVVSHAAGRDLYRVNIRPAIEAALVTPDRVRYVGKVYCVNVPNHVVCVRRNGRAAWCGNCYDEGKRVAETLAFDYHRQNNVDIRVPRIFNSLTGDQPVIYYQGNQLYYESFADCYNRIHQDISNVSVPCFDSQGNMVLKPISAIWKHKVTKKGYEITTTWGKRVKITEDHSLFTCSDNGLPQPVFGKDLQVGDLVAVPSHIPFIDKALEPFYITDKIASAGISICPEDVVSYLEQYRQQIYSYLQAKGVDPRQHYSYLEEYETGNRIPLELWQYLGLAITPKERIATASSAKRVNNYIENLEDFLWFLGFYLAEGCLIYREEGDYQLSFSSDLKYLEKLVAVCGSLFGCECKIQWDEATGKAPSVNVRSKIIVDLVVNSLGFGKNLSTAQDIPNWILQLPPAQLVHFLQGFWQGDGNHDAKTTGSKLIFNSSSQAIIEKLVLMVAKFGIIGSVSEFYTTVSKSNPKQYKSYRLTIQGLDNYDILALARAVQTLQAKTTNHLAWARVKEITPFEIDDFVYDFSVPDGENFIGGTYGICCHNTYGPRMLENDGRVVSNFVAQALRGIPLTVYGDGSQTRSFCYVSDLVEGLIRLMNGDFIGPVNLGNPGEYTILELAQKIQHKINPDVEIVFKELPQDDPKQRQPDITRAKTYLGWEPTVPLDEGLNLMIEDFRQRLSQS